MLQVFDQQSQESVILENAYDKSLERSTNELWYFSFSMPIDDWKNTYCNHYNYVDVISKSGRNYGKYRVMPIHTKKHENFIRYECEHVLSTLMDTVIDGFITYTNLSTRTVLESLLTMQEEAHWVLGECDFNMMFSYGFENENGLLAPILSVPKAFAEPYEFTFNTDVYPWVLNLKQSSNVVQSEYRWGKDILEFDEHVDPTEIVNYLIPKGAGEGVNQLTIKDVNGGLNYLKDDVSIAKWGKRPYIHIDRRFTQADSLKGYAENLLKDWKEPKFSFEVKAADLSILPGYEHEQRFLNTVSNVIVGDKIYVARITGDKIKDLDREQEVDYVLGNKLGDIAQSSAEYERKVSVNEAYSQGATNLLAYSYNDNADQNNPADIMVYLPDEMVNINKLLLTYKTDYFRAYEQAIEGGGATTLTSSSGGGTTVSSSSGGGTSSTSSSGGGTSTSTASDGDHSHRMFLSLIGPVQELNQALFQGKNSAGQSVNVNLPANGVDLYTYSSSGTHSHAFTISDHSHTFTVQNHTHSITLQNHSHSLTLPNHTHAIKFGIYKHPDLPTEITIEVDGNVVNINDLEYENLELAPYLEKDNEGKVLRGWHTISITPNDLGRINANVLSQFFIQSRGGDLY